MIARTTTAVAGLCLVLLGASPAGGGTPACSVHPKKGASKADLAAAAKIDEPSARKAALATLSDPAKATVRDSELEAEHGCLVYSFDIEIAGKKGVQEIQVDAGDGKILSSQHESPKVEAAEKARDKAGP